MQNNKFVLKLVPWIIPISLIIIWQLIASFHLIDDTYIKNISSPYLVLKSLIDLYKNENLITHILISTQRALIGFIIGGCIGFFLGIVVGSIDFCRLLMDKSLQMLRNIPHLSLIPLFILWFGIGELSKVLLVALGTFFPIYLNTYHGIRSIDSNLIEMAKSYGVKGWDYFFNILIPGALPSIFVGMRFALGIMWLTLIVAETIASSSGIGYLAMQAREFIRTDIIIFTIILYALLGVLSDFIVKVLEKKFLSWNFAYQKQ